MSSKRPEREVLMQALVGEGRRYSTATVLFHQAVGERLGLNPTDHKCADLLSQTGPVTAGELAELTGLTTGAVTGVVDRLERVGFVRRESDPGDRRRVIVRPVHDPQREREVGALFEPMARAWTEMCSAYSDRDLELILDFMEKSRAILRDATVGLREGASRR